MNPSSENLIIEANFKPNRLNRLLGLLWRVGVVLLCLLVLGAMVVYGLTVHYQSKINSVSAQARDMSEENRELEVQLSRIRSYKNIEASAAQAPQLRLPEEILEIKAGSKPLLPKAPTQTREVPRVYGY